MNAPTHLDEDEGRRLRPLVQGLLAAGLARASSLPCPGGVLEGLSALGRIGQSAGLPALDPSPLADPMKSLALRRDPGAALLHDLFLADQAVDRRAVERWLAPELLDEALAVGLLSGSSRLKADIRLLCFAEMVFLHDSPSHRAEPGYAYMGRATGWLMREGLRAVRSRRIGRVLDLGTGQGAVALVVAREVEEVLGTDIDGRLLALARATAAANGVTNARFFHSDVFESVEGQFDLILTNPPQGIGDSEGMGTHDHGARDFRRRVLRESLERLAPDGELIVGFSIGWAPDSDAFLDTVRDDLGAAQAQVDVITMIADYSVSQHEWLASRGLHEIRRGVMRLRRARETSIRCHESRPWTVRLTGLRARILRAMAPGLLARRRA